MINKELNNLHLNLATHNFLWVIVRISKADPIKLKITKPTKKGCKNFLRPSKAIIRQNEKHLFIERIVTKCQIRFIKANFRRLL